MLTSSILLRQKHERSLALSDNFLVLALRCSSSAFSSSTLSLPLNNFILEVLNFKPWYLLYSSRYDAIKKQQCHFEFNNLF